MGAGQQRLVPHQPPNPPPSPRLSPARSGVRAYLGLRMPNIVYLVTSGKHSLSLPPGTPKGYEVGGQGVCGGRGRQTMPRQPVVLQAVH